MKTNLQSNYFLVNFLLFIVSILVILNIVLLSFIWFSNRGSIRGPSYPASTSTPFTQTPVQTLALQLCGEPNQGTCYKFYKIKNNKFNIALLINDLSNKNVYYAKIDNIRLQCRPNGDSDDSILCTGPFFYSGMWKIQLYSQEDENVYTGNIFIDLSFNTSTPTATSTVTPTATATTHSQYNPTRTKRPSEPAMKPTIDPTIEPTIEPTSYP